MELPYISGDVNPKRLLIFQDVTFRAQKMKKKKTLLKSLLHFRKWNVLTTSLKNFLYFRRNFQGLEIKNCPFALWYLLLSPS